MFPYVAALYEAKRIWEVEAKQGDEAAALQANASLLASGEAVYQARPACDAPATVREPKEKRRQLMESPCVDVV